jgi:hypothetical protein
MTSCSECGAPLPEGGTCRDYFYELLALEAQVPGGPGELPHFFAVASYNLQHPLQFTPEAVQGLRTAVADVLAGRATLDDVRRRVRYATNGPTHVLRRPGSADEESGSRAAWPTEWPITVLDVCRVSPEEYRERVRQWGETVSSALDEAARPEPPARRASRRRRR